MLMRKPYIDDLATRFFYWWWWWLFLCWRKQHWVGRTDLVGRWELFLIRLRCWMLSTIGYHKSHFWLNEDDNYKVEYLFWSQHRDYTKSVFPALRNISPLINFKSHFQEGGWHSVHHWQFHGPDPTEEHGTLPWVDEEEVKQANTTTTKALSRCKRGICFHTLCTARCLLMAITNLNEILRLLSAGKIRRETQCSLFTCRILWN